MSKLDVETTHLSLVSSLSPNVIGTHSPPPDIQPRSFLNSNYSTFTLQTVIVVEAFRNICGATLLKSGYEDYEDFNLKKFQSTHCSSSSTSNLSSFKSTSAVKEVEETEEDAVEDEGDKDDTAGIIATPAV
jgi:hypothetical protein